MNRSSLASLACSQPSRGKLPRLLGNSGTTAASRHKGGRVAQKTSTQSHNDVAAKGAISMLQEFVQSSQTFSLPANYSVLQWEFDSQMADAATLEFRAIVSFLLEGVPHHVAGTWQPKKKDAQRDAAERALHLFAGKTSSERALHPERALHLFAEKISKRQHRSTPSESSIAEASEEERLSECCRTLDVCCATPPSWSVSWDSCTCLATVEITLLGVLHKFAGAAQGSEAEARADTAKRVLWYLQSPGFENVYEPDPSAPAIATMKIPRPPAGWAGFTEEEALEVAERKTAIMRVQNRLQQSFELRPGLSAWSWTYDVDADDEEWPVRCRATVTVPVIGKVFTGCWVRGQRDAQLDALSQVTHFLDELERTRA